MNNCVTFYDTRGVVLSKYPSAAESLRVLDSKQVEQHFGIDVAALGRGDGPFGSTCVRRFDVISFYFPHVGGDNGQPAVVAANRQLIRTFLDGATKLLAAGGEIQIAVKTGGTYDKWNVRQLFDETNEISLVHQFNVDKAQFPGYVHRLTKGGHGKFKQVSDEGAQLYVLQGGQGGIDAGGEMSSTATVFDRLKRLDARVLVCEIRTLVPLTDNDVEAQIKLALDEANASLDVLGIRRTFKATAGQEIIPDTRQCNRVAYSMEARGIISREAPASDRSSKKPRWSLGGPRAANGKGTTAMRA